jgi:hypothetical protein
MRSDAALNNPAETVGDSLPGTLAATCVANVRGATERERLRQDHRI